MELSWGTDLWDRLDDIINHTNLTSTFIDKCHKCFIECNQIWIRASHKQKRVLDKLQLEFSEPAHTEFTMTTGLLNLINNFISIYNITSTYSDSVSKASDEFFKKSHAQLRKETSDWISRKQKMEDDLNRSRKTYEIFLKKYRDKFYAMKCAENNFKKSDENRNLSRSQVDAHKAIMQQKKNEYELSKQDYALQIRDFNTMQQTYFRVKVRDWAKDGERIYEQKLNLIKGLSTNLSKLTTDMLTKLNYSVTRFSDIKSTVSFTKDAVLLVQRCKTGDVPPNELQFIDLDNRDYSSTVSDTKSQETSDSEYTESESGSATSDSAHNEAIPRESANHSNASSFYLSSTSHEPKSEMSRATVQSIKLKNNGKVVNPEAKFTFRKSSKIFRSSTPWRDSGNEPVSSKQSLYQRRGRNLSRESNHRRSRSVSDMISSVVRSSLRLKGKNESHKQSSKRPQDSLSYTGSHGEISGQSFSDFDSDSASDGHRRNGHPQIVSTPAEALEMKRRESLPDYVLSSMQSTTSVDQTKGKRESESLNQPVEYEQCEYGYVGSCISIHEYNSEDTTNQYLSFNAGDQFYILKFDDGCGWMYVETIDRTAQGFVPTTYMDIHQYDNLSEAVV